MFKLLNFLQAIGVPFVWLGRAVTFSAQRLLYIMLRTLGRVGCARLRDMIARMSASDVVLLRETFRVADGASPAGPERGSELLFCLFVCLFVFQLAF